MRAYNSYSEVMFNPQAMRNIVAHLANELPALQEQFVFNTIAVTGKSGAALGFALSMVTDINVVYVRKGETTHGDLIEGGGVEFERYAFLDDFVSSGDSRKRVEDELNRYSERRYGLASLPKRVLTIEYARGIAESKLKVEKAYGMTHNVFVCQDWRCCDDADFKPQYKKED